MGISVAPGHSHGERLRRQVIVSSLIAILFMSGNILAASGSIEGYVKDSGTSENLFGANVIVMGTSVGAATDPDGKFVIQNVPEGSYEIRASYIGYESLILKAVVKAGVKTEVNFELELVGIEGGEIQITAQASGQKQAINQQLSSDHIINVVSANKIQELPDANAAESIGRIAGVSVLRDGGEGNSVVIRGLQPKFNKILIDGVEMSSSDPNDRGTDLSSISSSMLAGIEVSKTMTADMEADALGGTVNFSLREAKSSGRGFPLFDLLVQGGYNDLSNVYNKYNNYKYVISAEDRYYDERLGVLAQINIERKNLTSNELGATYTHAGESYTDYYTTGLGLSYIPRDRQRYNAVFVVDYKLPDGKIKFSNFLSSGSTKRTSRYEYFSVEDNTRTFELSNATDNSKSVTNSLELDQRIPFFDMHAKVSQTYAEVDNPFDWAVNFYQNGAGINEFTNAVNVNPENIPKAANNDFDEVYMNGISSSKSFSKEQAYSASLDFTRKMNFSNNLSAELKFGGMYRYQTKYFDYTLYNGGGLQFGDADYVNELIIDHFDLPVANHQISLPYFEDPNFSYGEFLDGKYEMVGPLDYGKLLEVVKLMDTHFDEIQEEAPSIYARNNYASESADFSGHENKSAFYVMSVIKVGSQLTLIPGVRYQNLSTTYTGVQGVQNRLSYYDYPHYNSTVTNSYGYWLPNFSLKYKPFAWFDVRASYTKTLAYPDFISIIPRIDFDGNYSVVSYNNTDLVPQRSTNYDLYFSFYSNSIGLFTIGGFLKQVDDLIYAKSFYVTGDDMLQYYPPEFLTDDISANGVYEIDTYINNPRQVDDYGIEMDWQTHFWYLPKAFSGLVLGVNYTHIFSEAEYPITLKKTVNRKSVYVDTTFTARLIEQPDDMVNLSLGYDYKDFSIRVSMLYHTDIFTGADFWPQLRSNTESYRRWDLAVKQVLPWYGVQVFANINNINGAKDISVIQGGANVPTSEQQYGLTATMGLRWSF